MKISMFDKVLALGLVLAVYGISLKAGHNTNKEALLGQMDQVEVTVNEQTDKQKNVDYNQVRKCWRLWRELPHVGLILTRLLQEDILSIFL